MRLKTAITLTLVLSLGPLVTIAQAEIDAEQVRQSIRRGVEFLKTHQDKTRGNWPEYQLQPGGLSALITLAMLNAGEDPKAPHMQKALDYLRSLDRPEMTYSTALQTMVFCAAEPERDRLLIRRNVNWLESIQITSGDGAARKGSWAYSARQGNGDNSNTQFALLALHEAERVGVEVKDSTWRLALAYWRQCQNQDGSWGYLPGQGPTGSMTCAGIASMVIAADKIGGSSAGVRGDQVICCGGGEDDQDAQRIERGLRWLGTNFSVRTNPGDRFWLYYYLYGVERVGRMTGRRFIGQQDWYRLGAEMLVAQQDQFSGYWRSEGHAESNPLVATSLAILFLSKGRRPVVVAKAQWSGGLAWDVHPGGIPKLTRSVERLWSQDLSWQTIDLRAATLEDLLETPVLFLSGQDALRLTAEQIRTLRDYVGQGGFLFVEACNGNGCDGKAFEQSFRDLARQLFPDSELRLLQPDHPVWYAEKRVDPKYMRPLYGIDACCRTSVVFCPENLSCFWELSSVRDSGYPPQVQEEIDASLAIGQNVLAYATNRVLKEKLDRPRITFSDDIPEIMQRGVLNIPKISHGGGSDDAPNALSNLLRFVETEIEMRVETSTRLLETTDPQLYQFPILFMHGRRDFRFTEAQRRALAEYIENGGFVMADAICASPEFANAVRREMKLVFPDQAMLRIPVSHPLFGPEFGGDRIEKVTLNDPKLRGQEDRLDARRTLVTPLLEAIEVNGRLAVVLSPYDLSCALENHVSLDCKGYLRSDAERIGLNIIMFALHQ